MASRDDELPILHQDHDYADDYDVDFMHALMNLDDQMEDASNSDNSPFKESTMNLNNDSGNLEGCYFVLCPEDIVCGAMPEHMRHHPGKALFERIVANFVLPYALETKNSERQSILAKIYSQIEIAASRSAGRRPLRCVFPAEPSDELPCYQVASQDEIMEEIKFSIKSHFIVIPRSVDVLFGSEQPCQDFPGNVALRRFIDNQSGNYASASPTDQQRILQATRASVTTVGGRFLLPFDGALPMYGCVEAPDDAIMRIIAQLYRGGPTLYREGIETAQALPILLEPEDIVCGRRHGMTHHPGNVMFELIVSEFVLPYGLATRELERQSLLAEIYSQIEMASRSAGRPPLRYVVPTEPSVALPYYQVASQDEIMEEIKFSIKSHFNVIPTPNDVLFGRGQPCRDFPGNIRLRTFIQNQRPQYLIASHVDRRRMIQVTRETVTSVGGRFLLPFDKARPSDGCVQASDAAITRTIAHLYRARWNLRQEDIEMAQALPS